MMYRRFFFRWVRPGLVVLVGALMLAAAPKVRAGASITLQEVGVAGPTTIPLTVVGGVYSTGPILFGDYSINVTGSDSAPGINAFSGAQEISQNTFTVKELNTGAGNLIITMQDNSFTNLAPGNTGELANSLSATEIDSGSVSALGFVNTTSNATSSVTINAPVEPPTGASAGSSALVALGSGSTLTLGNVATISGLDVGATDNFTVTTTLVTPAPAGALLVLAGLPALGLAGWMRRRKTELPAA